MKHNETYPPREDETLMKHMKRWIIESLFHYILSSRREEYYETHSDPIRRT